MEPKIRMVMKVDSVEDECSSFKASKSTDNLHYHVWKPTKTEQKEKEKVVLVLVHGLGDHVGHMMTVVEHFTHLGFTIYGYDQRGHGDSPGARGHVDNWEYYIKDLNKFCKFVVKKEENCKIILFGNSMGGLVTLDYLTRDNFNSSIKGAIVNAPAMAMVDVPTVVGFGMSLISKLLPKTSMKPDLDSSKCSRDKIKQQENSTDELVHSTISFNLLASMYKTGKRVSAIPQKLTIPVLLLQGDSDPIVDAKHNVAFFKLVSVTNPRAKTIITSGGKHETFNDVDREDVLKQAAQFVAEIISMA